MKTQMKIQMTYKNKFLAAIFLFSLSMLSHAQCLPTDYSCNSSAPARRAPSAGFDVSLTVPPQLATEELNPPELIQGSDWTEENTRRFIPSGSPSWGAIAKDYNLPGVQGLGVSDNWATEGGAVRSAFNICQRNGGKECSVEATYFNACLGIAETEKGELFWLTGENRELAIQKVMQLCVDKKRGGCRLVYGYCSYPAQ